ncbi:MAG: Ig-like domain-containing protein [Patescibacteria group bacterium]|jgi:hypothetical protein
MQTKKIAANLFLAIFLLFCFTGVSYAYQWSCSDIGVAVPTDLASDSYSCGDADAACVDAYNTKYNDYIACTGRGGCWDIVRYEALDTPDKCPLEGDLRAYWTQYTDPVWVDGAVAYCQCVRDCQASKPPQAERDQCDVNFSTCCNDLAASAQNTNVNSAIESQNINTNISQEDSWQVTISPKEVEVVADGATSVDFKVLVLKNGSPAANESVGFVLNDDRSTVEDSKEGSITASAAATDANGEVKLTYASAEQPPNFKSGQLTLQATHAHGNPVATINLKPGYNLQCGNWKCESEVGENIKNCPSDCSRDVSYEEAKQYIINKYEALVELNPRVPEGSYCGNCVTNMRTGNATLMKWITWDPEKEAYWQRALERYEPYVCGSFQEKVLTVFHSLRLSNDATERKMMSYFDFGPVELFALSHFFGHQAAVLYPTGTLWQDTGMVFDPWIYNRHDIYTTEQWEQMSGGQANAARCDRNPNYPMCGQDYLLSEMSKKGQFEFKLSDEEDKFFKALPTETKNKISATLERTNKEIFSVQRKYLIQNMMRQDMSQKVRIIVDCPVAVTVTDKNTGQQIGLDKDGNTIATADGFLQEVRYRDANDFVSYFILPKDGNYEVIMAGTAMGQANIYTSYPQETGSQFEIYEYKNVPIKDGSVLTTTVSLSDKTAGLIVDGQEVKPVLKTVGANEEGLNGIMNMVVGAYPAKKVNNGFDWISISLLALAVIIFVLPIILFRKKIILLILGILLSLILLSAFFLYFYNVYGRIKDSLNNLPTVIVEDTVIANANINTNIPVAVNTNNNSNTSQETVSDNKILNEDYGFSLNLGEYAVNTKINTLDEPYWGKAQYVYCFKTTETGYASTSCKNNQVELFTVTVATQKQWNKFQEDALIGAGETVMGEKNDLLFILSHPNGMMPSDAPQQLQKFYNKVIGSIEFTK